MKLQHQQTKMEMKFNFLHIILCSIDISLAYYFGFNNDFFINMQKILLLCISRFINFAN